ncbi:hypothetical protein [Arenimonas alkanexedens]
MSRPDPITDNARSLFDRATERLDQGAAFRLRRARHEAQQPRRRNLPGMVPAGAFAATVLALGLAWWMPTAPAPSMDADEFASTAPVSDFDTLLAEEDPALYLWLADAPVATSARSGP